MRRTALYSRSVPPPPAPAAVPATATPAAAPGRWRRALRDRSHAWALLATGIACALAAVLLYRTFRPAWDAPSAAMAAIFPALAESTRTLV